MVKKIYAFAVVMFVFLVLFAKDVPDFPEETEVEMLSQNTTAECLRDYPGQSETRQYYRLKDERQWQFDKYIMPTYLEIVLGIEMDENGSMQITSVEEKWISGGGNGFELKDVVNATHIETNHTFINYAGQFVKEAEVDQAPTLKYLPGMFLKDIKCTQTWYCRTDIVSIAYFLSRKKVMELAKTNLI